MLLDHERQVRQRGRPRAACPRAIARLTPRCRVGEGIAGKVVQLGEPVLVEDIAIDPRFTQPTRVQATVPAPCMCLPGARGGRASSAWSTPPESGGGAATPAFSPTDLHFPQHAHDPHRLRRRQRPPAAGSAAGDQPAAAAPWRTCGRPRRACVEGETLRAVGQMASGMAHHVNNLLAVISGRAQLLLARATAPEVRGRWRSSSAPPSDAGRRRPSRARLRRDCSRRRPGAPVDLQRHRARGGSSPPAALARRGADAARSPSTSRSTSARSPRVAGEAAGAARGRHEPASSTPSTRMPSGAGRIRVTTWAADDLGLLRRGRRRRGHGATRSGSRALEPFFTTKGPQRHGPGLSVAHSVVQRHRRRAEPPAQRRAAGSVVTLRLLPCRRTGRPPPRPAPTPIGRAAAHPDLIDDEPTVREALADRAGRGRPCRGPGAQWPGGPGPPERAGHPVDLVLTDLGMPEMTGWGRCPRRASALARAAGRARSPAGPVALEMSDEERRGVDFVLAGPYTVETLRSALAAVRPAA